MSTLDTRSGIAGNDPRLARLLEWLEGLPAAYGILPASARPASNDASFRRYFRVDATGGAGSLIVMDAPPPMEDCRPFVHAARVLGDAGMSVPRVLEADLGQGFLLLTDFGNLTYLEVLDEHNADTLYAEAGGALIALQAASRPGVFPEYERELLLRELTLFPDWYVAKHKGIELSAAETRTLHDAFEALLANNLAQARVYVHRDYHSRNLMLIEGPGNPGVLDFQDAVHGPITYDLVSLMRDAYVQWPEERVIDWTIRHWERSRKAGLAVPGDFADFYRDFEWMGLQRHLKVLGIFARLHHRDGKERYLADLPLVLDYTIRAASRYNAFSGLVRLLERIEHRGASVGYTF